MIDPTPAFYEIVHTPTGMIYGGCTSNMLARVAWHKSALTTGQHSSKRFQRYFTKWSDCKVRIYYTDTFEQAQAFEAEFLRENVGRIHCCNSAISNATSLGYAKLWSRRPVIVSNWRAKGIGPERLQERKEKIKLLDHVRIEIDGVQYNSIAAAVRTLDIQHGTITRRLASKNFTNYKRLK